MSEQVALFGRHSYLSETTGLHGTSDPSALLGGTAGEDQQSQSPRRDVMPRDSHIIQAPDVIRLSEENLAVLARLKEGPASARELTVIALGYRQRIHDLRCAGYNIPKPVGSVYRLD